jgi:thiamine biosynthesis protein ThiS
MELLIDGEKRDIRFKGSVAELLRKLKCMREEVVVKVNGRLVPETRGLSWKDRVEVMKVVFGG